MLDRCVRCSGETSQDCKLEEEESAPEAAAHVMVRLMGGAHLAGPALNAFMDACSTYMRQHAIPHSWKYLRCASRSGPERITRRMCVLTRVQGSSCAADPCCAIKAAISRAELLILLVRAVDSWNGTQL